MVKAAAPAADEAEIMRALALGAALSAVIRSEPFQMAGAALGVAIGNWLKPLKGAPLLAQEAAIDKIMIVAMKQLQCDD